MREHQPQSGAIDLRELWTRISGDSGSPRAVAIAVSFVLSFYVGLALAYRDSIPLFEARDEPAHLHYAAFVFAEGRLPQPQRLEVPGAGAQPPLAYVVAAPLLGAAEELDVALALDDLRAVGLATYGAGFSGGGGSRLARTAGGTRRFASDGSHAELQVLRSTSLVFGVLAVIFTFAATWRASHDARLSLLAASLLAFDPQFLFTSGTFSNDAAGAAVGAASLWLVVRALGDSQAGPSRAHYLAAALLLAVGLLTKVAALPGLLVAVAAIAASDRRPPRERHVDLALAAGAALALCAPYALWVARHGGGALGFAGAAIAAAAELDSPERYGGPLAYLTGRYWVATFQSYWCGFGWSDVAAPDFVYLAFFALCWTGVLGFAAGLRRDGAQLIHARALRGYLAAAVVATGAAHLALNLAVASPHGRQLFAIAPQFSLLLALGIWRLIGSERRMLALAAVIAVVLVALDVYCLRAVLVPAYWQLR